MIKIISLAAAFFIFLTGCASNRAFIKQDFHFASIQTVRVGNFTPASGQPNSGSVVRSAFIRQLLERGYTIVTGDSEADAVIEGSVISFMPERRFLITTPDHRSSGHNHIFIHGNDMVEIGGSNVYDLGPAFGLGGGNSRIMASNATVGIAAHMIDTATGKIVWSNSQTFEGLDLISALNGAVRLLLRSLPRQ
ncbi:MAG: LPS assembly lipoprotein LptE [Endomicrobia bacterium]|nr:LPS assembly lipoprotein LptE [Endomicrobiia bacterium]